MKTFAHVQTLNLDAAQHKEVSETMRTLGEKIDKPKAAAREAARKASRDCIFNCPTVPEVAACARQCGCVPGILNFGQMQGMNPPGNNPNGFDCAVNPMEGDGALSQAKACMTQRCGAIWDACVARCTK